jgi:hypothetical protein
VLHRVGYERAHHRQLLRVLLRHRSGYHASVAPATYAGSATAKGNP